MTVIPFDPCTYIHSNEPAHIDNDSRWLLLTVLSDLVRVRAAEPDPQRAEKLDTITNALGTIIERFEPPKGGA